MRKAAAAAKGSSAPSPQPGPEGPFGAEPMRRTGSGDRPARVPSSLSIRKDSPLPRNDGSVPGTPMRSTPRPTATRTSSSNTAVYTTRNLGGSSKAPMKPGVADTQRRRLSSLPIATSVDDQEDPDPPSPSPAESSDSEEASSSSSSSPAQSRIIRRPPRFQGNDAASSFADDEDTEPAFLPYKPDGSGGQHDLSATLRGNPRDYSSRRHGLKGSSGRDHHHHHHHRIHQSQTSDSSASSATTPLKSVSSDQSRPGGSGAGPLSPRRTMELARRSPGGGPKGKGVVYSRDSDGTPSMGSSFSDLDGMDTFVFSIFPPLCFTTYLV